MSLGGQDQFGTQVVVYGPDGRMYGNEEQARAAGVENLTFRPPENFYQGATGEGGALAANNEMALRQYFASQPSAAPQFYNTGAITDPTALAQQAILARPMSQSFTGQPIMSRDVPMVSNEYSGLIYPEIRLPAIAVPQYSGYGSQQNSGGGGDGGGFGDGPSSAGMGGASEGSAGSTAGTASSPDGPDGSNASGDSGGDSKIVCTAMNHQYGFGSFRNAIWLKYAQTNLTKAHEAGYHAMFLPLVDFAFKQGDSKAKLLTRKFLENVARHRSLDLRAEMRGTKRDTLGMIYRSILEPLCYAVGKFKGY